MVYIYIVFFFLFNRLFKDILINKKVFGILFLVSIILNYIKLNYILDKFVLHFIVFLIGRIVAKYNLLQQLQKWYVKIIALCALGICFFQKCLLKIHLHIRIWETRYMLCLGYVVSI